MTFRNAVAALSFIAVLLSVYGIGASIDTATPLIFRPSPDYKIAPGPGVPDKDTFAGPQATPSELDTVSVYSWDFEGGGGAADPQGWTDPALTQEAFFHVDDFVGLSTLAPLEGTKSLWCGTRGTSPQTDHYNSAPGYGNDWRQFFESVPYATSGDLTISFLASYDLLDSSDAVALEVLSVTNRWRAAWVVAGAGASGELVTEVIPADSIGATVRFRFTVYTNGSFSHEDAILSSGGALLVDSLTITDNSGVVDFQDFEAEAVNDLATSDGDWSAATQATYAGLVSGAGVVQETGSPNSSNFWGFFSGSPDNYTCNGFPGQQVVPYGPPQGDLGNPWEYVYNEVRSPWVPVDSPRAQLSMNMYRDLAVDALVFHGWRIRYRTGGVESEWLSNGMLYYNESTDWATVEYDLTQLAATGVDEMQISVFVFDGGNAFSFLGFSGECHSHGPLIDDVTLTFLSAPYEVTNVNDSGPGSLRDVLASAHADSAEVCVTFAILSGSPPFRISLLSPLPAITKKMTIDGFSQPGSSPNASTFKQVNTANIPIVIEESTLSVPVGLQIATDSCVVKGLAFYNNFGSAGIDEGTAISIVGDYNTVSGCYVGTQQTLPIGSSDIETGISISGNGNQIGGILPEDRMHIARALSENILVTGDDNRIEGCIIGVDRSTNVTPMAPVNIDLSGDSNVIGSAGQGGNVIANADNFEVRVQSTGNDNMIVGNRIGTTLDGNSRFTDANRGISNSGLGTTIGGSNPGEGNTLAGASTAPIYSSGRRANIQGNNVGQTDGGINIDGVSNNSITVLGDTTWVTDNVVANSLSHGIAAVGGFTQWAGIANNDVFDHPNGIGIELGLDGVDTNDPGDGDGGVNQKLNKPVFASAVRSGGVTTVTGNIDVPAGGVYEVAYYLNRACGSLGVGLAEQSMSVVGAAGNYSVFLEPTEAGNVTPVNVFGAFVQDVDWSEAIAGRYLTATTLEFASMGSSVFRTSETSACVLITNSPTGTNVVVDVEDGAGNTPAILTFDEITGGGGVTTVSAGTAGSCPAVPGAYLLVDSICYDIDTDATYTGNVEVRLAYDPVGLPVPENGLRLLHYDGGAWVDITTSVDTAGDRVVGVTSSLSPFMLAYDLVSSSPPTPVVADRFELMQNIPNPFNPTTVIPFNVPRGGAQVSLTIYDVSGRRVVELVNGFVAEGRHDMVWTGVDSRGASVASGIYFYRLRSGDAVVTRKMVLLK